MARRPDDPVLLHARSTFRLGVVDDLVENDQLLDVVLREILSHPLAAQQRPHVDYQLEQIRRVLPVEPREKVLLLFGLLQLFEQIVLFLVRLQSKASSCR